MKYKVYTVREFERILNNNNYEFIRFTGDHKLYKHKYTKQTITFKFDYINPMIARRIIKENKLKI